MSEPFSIRIVRQGWLEGCSPAADLCSHGTLALTVAGVPIADDRESYGISETALALLRTLRHDYEPGSDDPTDILVFHGCGSMLMSGCGLGIEWRVAHRADGSVELSDVRRYDAPSGGERRDFLAARITLPEAHYAAQVVAFAREARRLFEQTPKEFEANEFHPGEFRAFWDEFDELLRQHGVTELPPLAA